MLIFVSTHEKRAQSQGSGREQKGPTSAGRHRSKLRMTFLRDFYEHGLHLIPNTQQMKKVSGTVCDESHGK